MNNFIILFSKYWICGTTAKFKYGENPNPPKSKEGEIIRKRIYEKHIRLNQKELEILEKLARKTGLTESELLRSCLTNIVFKEAPPKEFYDLLNKINNIGININQIAHIANSTGEIYVNDLKLYLSEINRLIIEIRKKYL